MSVMQIAGGGLMDRSMHKVYFHEEVFELVGSGLQLSLKFFDFRKMQPQITRKYPTASGPKLQNAPRR